jgi:hypothetical protein
MQVHINEVVSRVRAVDSESLLTREVLQRIVAAVVEAMNESHRSDRTLKNDTRFDSGGVGER